MSLSKKNIIEGIHSGTFVNVAPETMLRFIEEKEIGGEPLHYYRMNLPSEKLKVMIPVNKLMNKNLSMADKNLLDNACKIFISELALVREVSEEHATHLFNHVVSQIN